MSHTLKSASESGQEARIVQIDFSAAFDWVNHQGRTVLKESDDLVILGVTFDTKMIFEKHLRLVSRAAS